MFFILQGTGEFINTKFFCRVCSMLHDPKVQTEHFSYEDVNDWWRGKGTCINGSWRKFQKALDAEAKRNKSSSTPATSSKDKAKASVQPPSADTNEAEINKKAIEAAVNVEIPKSGGEAKLP